MADVVAIHGQFKHQQPHHKYTAYSNAAPPTDQKFQRTILASLQLPEGLQTEILRSTRDFAARFWVVDNSGSMVSPDGHVFAQSGELSS